MDLKELDSFKLGDAVKFHDKLNPKLWHGQHLQPEVKKQLLVIAEDFLQELGVSGLNVKDITVSGSNAAFSYTPHSDLDLHILVDMSKLPNDDVYQELFTAKKTLYNDSHDISVHGVPVELYVQDSNQPVVSLGEYSLLNDKWLRIPTKRRANFDQTASKAKYDKLAKVIDYALQSDDLHKVMDVLKTIKRYRQAGLDKGGEFSPENLAFKSLRHQGHIKNLYALRDKLHSDSLTIETMYQNPENLDKPTKNVSQIAKDHDVAKLEVLWQLMKGVKVEKEHTSVGKVAREIALDHLDENPHYYDELAKVGLEEDATPEFVFHVTPTKNLKSIAKQGLVPGIGDRSKKIAGEQSGIFVFADQTSAEDAVMNWLGDEFDDEPLTMLKIDVSGLEKNISKGADYEWVVNTTIDPKRIKKVNVNLEESASGYIPSDAEKDDPRYKTALTVDIKPDTMMKNAKKLGSKISRAGIPPTLQPSGKI